METLLYIICNRAVRTYRLIRAQFAILHTYVKPLRILSFVNMCAVEATFI
jgi:hypothetical protein